MSSGADDALDLDATAQAELVSARQLKSIELVDAAIARIEQHNPTLNAVIHTQYERARDEAEGDLPAGPFTGVPFLLKDFGGEEVGEPHCAGLQVAKDAGHVGTKDSIVAKRFRAAGLVPLGRTNTPELASMGTTEPTSFGPTHNPWDTSLTPGGSSGGSGSAVAARLVATAHANDIAGSIRIPAAHCGLVGLKASRWRLVYDGVPTPIGMVTEGAVARSVRDVAAITDALAAPAGNSWWSPPLIEGSLVDAVDRRPTGLRVGLTTDAFNGVEVEDQCAAAANEVGSLLESLGHSVQTSRPDGLDSPLLDAAMKTAMVAQIAMDARAWSQRLGRELEEGHVEPSTWTALTKAQALHSAELLESIAQMEHASREATRWWEDDGFDILITPATAEGPAVLGELKKNFKPGRSSAFTRVFNATGHPVISLPLGWPDDGVPRGVQLIAAHGREDLLMSVAAQLEEAAPWSDRLPSL